MTEAIIRTSDRETFRRCRRLWHFTSKIRMNYEPAIEAEALGFGTAIHVGLEHFYNPETWEMPIDVKLALALKAFVSTNSEQLAGHPFRDTEDVQQEFEDRQELGIGMLTYYAQWSAEHDKFRPVMVEKEFEVPIRVPQGKPVPLGFLHRGTNNELKYGDSPVVYQGRLDLIIEDFNNKFFILDHKTAKQFGEITHLEVDTQVSSYAWALRELGVDIYGVIYSQLKKAYPTPPKTLKNGALSKDKRQGTTYNMYIQEIERLDLNEADYEDFLSYLKEQPEQYVRRVQLHRGKKELDNQGRMIYDEALDMLNDPSIYPNPNLFNCMGCAFKDPCLAANEGGDIGYFLDDSTLFRKRAEDA